MVIHIWLQSKPSLFPFEVAAVCWYWPYLPHFQKHLAFYSHADCHCVCIFRVVAQLEECAPGSRCSDLFIPLILWRQFFLLHLSETSYLQYHEIMIVFSLLALQLSTSIGSKLHAFLNKIHPHSISLRTNEGQESSYSEQNTYPPSQGMDLIFFSAHPSSLPLLTLIPNWKSLVSLSRDSLDRVCTPSLAFPFVLCSSSVHV